MNGFEVYCHYMAMKLHFTSPSYNYFRGVHKFLKKGSATYEKRKDKSMFYRLSRKLSNDEITSFLLSNFLVNQKTWTKDLLEPEARQAFLRWQKTQESLNYTFEQDFIRMKERGTITKLITPNPDGSYPEILTMLWSNDISIETVVIIHLMSGCLNVLDIEYGKDYVYSNTSFLIRKYIPFLNLNLVELKSIAKKQIIASQQAPKND